jgi:hypothetical protein
MRRVPDANTQRKSTPWVTLLRQVNMAIRGEYSMLIHGEHQRLGPFTTIQISMDNPVSEGIIILSQISMTPLGECLPDASTSRNINT